MCIDYIIYLADLSVTGRQYTSDGTIISMSLDDTKRCITIPLPKTAMLFNLVQKGLSYSNIMAKQTTPLNC